MIRGRHVIPNLCLILAVVLAGCRTETETQVVDPGSPMAAEPDPQPEDSTTSLFDEASSAFDRGEADVASKKLMELMIQQPQNDEAKLLAGRVEASLGQHRQALEVANTVSASDRALKIKAVRFCVQQAKQIGDQLQLEKSLRFLISAVPGEPTYAHELWQLFHRQGRTFEAAVIAERLCRSGMADTGELASLVFRGRCYPRDLPDHSTSEQSASEQSAAHQSAAKHFDAGLGMARWYFEHQQLEQAVAELQPNFNANKLSPAEMAFFGRLLAETQTLDDFATWHGRCGEAVKQYDEYWAAMGTYFASERAFKPAVGVLLQAVLRNPVDPVNYQRLAQTLDALGRSEDAEACRDQGIKIRQSQNLLDNSDLKTRLAATATQMAKKLVDLGRPFEALHWSQLAVPQDAQRQRDVIRSKRAQLNSVQDLMQMMRRSALLGLNPDDFDYQVAIASLSKTRNRSAGSDSLVKRSREDTDATPAKFRFADIAKSVGLDVQWYHGQTAKPDEIALYESLGGGVGVIDFDLDGWPDLYFAQGTETTPVREPADNAEAATNQLLRNLKGKYRDVTVATESADQLYSQGIAIGDVNQDGFPDILVGNIGANRLLINSGDGTFRDASLQLQSSTEFVTSSVAIADINNDALPDLFEVNYIRWQDAFDPIEFDSNGHEIVKGPLSHFAESDRWFENSGDSSFAAKIVPQEIAKSGTGLGVMITNLNEKDGNEIFISNDARPNHLLVRTDESFRNTADVQGVANGYFGSATACMGIAAGDFNRDGRLDLHVTNFLGEYDNLFLQTATGVFRDLSPGYGLHTVSAANLGFGSKAVDIDRDGWLDLIVTNGHISDQRHLDRPFRMKPVLLRSEMDAFRIEPVEDPSGYWAGQYLGRSIAVTDANRDGELDFVVTHLDRPAALLQNQTLTAGQHIQFELIGTASERGAIGARVSVTTDDGEYRQWVTAGDGYLCSDEPVLDFGLGNQVSINQVKVHWPSGVDQIFAGVPTGRRYLITEGQSTMYARETTDQ